MAVNLFICETLANSNTTAPVQFSDSLSGGGTGIDFGQVSSGSYAPIVDKSANTGAQVVYLSHDALVDPITDLEIYLDEYSQTYGGGVNPASDLASIGTEGAASSFGPSEKNNSSGLASGVWLDFKYDANNVNQFDASTNPVLIFNRFTPTGMSSGDPLPFPLDPCMYAPDSVSEAAPSAPQAGKIGKSSGSGFAGDSVLGNRAKLRKRVYLRSSFPNSGIFQFDFVYRFSFTS
jgi:hypothetical protein